MDALAFARRISRTAGDFLASHAGIHKMKFKGRNNPVTALDRESEAIITRGLSEVFPKDGILAEEGTSRPSKSNRVWVVDPLDGTTNYAHGLPDYCVSIALTLGGKPILGVVYAPKLGEEFYASKYGGAYRNGERIQVSREKNLSDAFLATGEPYDIRDNLDYHLGLQKKFYVRSLAIRRYGSACLDLCNVACGRFHGYWESGLKPWDAAAGILIVKEAHGKVTQYDGKPYVVGTSETIVASNGRIHQEMVKTLLSK